MLGAHILLTTAEYREAIALCRAAVYAHESYDGDQVIAGSFLGQIRILLDAASTRAELERIQRIRERRTAPPASGSGTMLSTIEASTLI